MSGTFGNISVPPTLVAFGITTVKASKVISPEFKWEGNKIYLIKHTALDNHMPDLDQLKANTDTLQEQILGIEDVDLADAITSYSWAQYCYNVSIKVCNSILSQSLMDYMNT